MTTSVTPVPGAGAQPGRPDHARTEGGEPTGRRRPATGDIRVHKDGTTWVVDVGVVCPGTTRYIGEGAATVPGTAAAVYEGVKMDKYSDRPNFVPFIVETGGRVAPFALCVRTSVEWRGLADVVRSVVAVVFGSVVAVVFGRAVVLQTQCVQCLAEGFCDGNARWWTGCGEGGSGDGFDASRCVGTGSVSAGGRDLRRQQQ
jgi:hypothetical protein